MRWATLVLFNLVHINELRCIFGQLNHISVAFLATDELFCSWDQTQLQNRKVELAIFNFVKVVVLLKRLIRYLWWLDPEDTLLDCETSLVLARVNDLWSVFDVVNVVECVAAQIFASEFDCQFWVHRATLRRTIPPSLLNALCRKLHEILAALPCRRSILQS